jgi:hypothetical protein
MVAIHLLSCIYGQKFWHYPLISFFGIELSPGQLLAVSTIITVSIALINNVRIILGKKTPLDEMGVKIPRRNDNIWPPFWSAAIMTLLAVVSYATGYFHVSPSLFVFTFGFTFAKLTMKLVVSF